MRDLVKGTSRLLPLPAGQGVNLAFVEFSPDGRHLAVTAANGVVNVWDLRQEKSQESWRGHAAGHRGIATYSPDGRLLATACGLTVRVWDAERREQVPEFKVSRGINQVCWSPDGQLLACASREDRVRIWELATGRERLLPTQGWWAICAAFSPDGRWFAWAGVHGVVAVYETTAFQRVATLGDLNGFVQCLTFSPDGQWLAAASINGPAKVWDVGSSRTLMTLHGHSSGVWDLAFSPDGSRLATAGADHRVHVWDITDEQEVATLRPLGPGRMNALAFSPNRRHLVTGQTDRLRLWDLETRTRTYVSPEPFNYLSAAFHPGGELFAGGRGDGEVRVLDIAGRNVADRKMKGFPSALLFTGGGRQLLVAGWENAVYRWEPGSPEAPRRVLGPLGQEDRSRLRPEHCAAVFSPNGRWLAYRESGRLLDIWDLTTGAKHLTLTDTPAFVPALAFDERGELLALGADEGTFQVRDVRTGCLLAAPQAHPTAIIGLAFVPDGSRLASTSADGCVKIWDPRAGVEVLSLREQATYDTAVAFSPDGELLVAGGWDGYPRVWSVADPAAEKAEVRLERQRLWHQRQADQAVRDRQWFAAHHHHGQLIELEPERWQHLAARARTHLELGKGHEALADFVAATAAPECSLTTHIDRARLHLHLGDAAGYRAACQKMLRVFGTRDDVTTQNTLAWVCVLGREPPVAADRPVRLVEAALDKAQPAQRRFILNTLGTALYRAGRWEEAIRWLDESVKAHGKGGIAEDWLVLAMAHHRLGQAEEAGRCYRRANERLPPQGGAPSRPDGNWSAWWDRIEQEMFLREAKETLGLGP